jgi:titin
VLDGSKAGPTAVGLDIQASSSTVSCLTVKNFAGGGAILDGSIDDFLESDNFGPGNGAFGVEFRGGASSNELFLDNISGNSGNAIVLNGSTTANNVLEFNTIASNGANGVVLDGSSSNYIAYNTITSNGGSGVDLLGGASHNTLTGNTLSANQYYGLYLSDPGTTANLVQGSFIGTDSSGNVAEGNGSDGVRVTNMASGNTIGGTSSGQRNIISGNHGNGVVITGSGTTGNMVEGDYIGTNAAGTGRLGNLNEGVVISQGASSNTVGGYYAYTGSRNVISANQDYGVYLTGTGTNSNTIENNFIGTDASGTHALGNVFGVMIDQGASYNTVYMDVLSGNMCGIAIFGPGTTGNFVYSDQIGTDVTETAALGNTWYGVYTYQSSGNYIDFNVIAYNGFGVISLATDQNYYYGNGIGGNLYADNYTF